MTQRLKNTSIENGFVRNPDRVYYEDFFEKLPGTLVDITFSGSNEITKTVSQPANTFLKEVYVVCSITIAMSSGNMGIIVQKDSSNIYVNGNNNVIAGENALAQYTFFVFPVIVGTSSFTNSQRNLEIKVNHTTSVSSGALKVIPVFKYISGGSGMNSNYLLSGTGIPQANLLTNSLTYSGITLKTSNTLDDNAVLFPNKDYPDSPISSGCLLPGSKIEMEATVIIPDITNVSVLCGLKMSDSLLHTSDNSQAYFAFGKASVLVGSGTDSDNWLFIYSKNGTDYITNLGIPVVADREYHIRIEFNKTRHISVYINGVQYGLSRDTTSQIASNRYVLSDQIIDSLALYPMMAVQTSISATKEMYINYVKLSRTTKKSYDD